MAKPKRSADTVTVACKLPQGLIVRVQLGDRIEAVKLHGVNSPLALMGHGMTDLPSAVWAAIEEQYEGAPWLKNEVIFAMGDRDSAVDKAEDRQEVKAGFEPIDPNKLPGAIQTAE